MAVWGIGAYFGESNGGDVSEEFIAKNIAVIGYTKTEHPEYYDLIEAIKEGDLIYIKSTRQNSNNSPIYLKAIGIVENADIEEKSLNNGTTASGIDVHWIQSFSEEPIKLQASPSPMRSVAIFEERNKNTIKEIISHLLNCKQ